MTAFYIGPGNARLVVNSHDELVAAAQVGARVGRGLADDVAVLFLADAAGQGAVAADARRSSFLAAGRLESGSLGLYEASQSAGIDFVCAQRCTGAGRQIDSTAGGATHSIMPS